MPKLKELSPRLRVGKGIERNNLTIFPLFGEGPIEAAEYVPIGAAIGLGYSLNAMADQSATTKRNGQSQAEAQELPIRCSSSTQ